MSVKPGVAAVNSFGCSLASAICTHGLNSAALAQSFDARPIAKLRKAWRAADAARTALQRAKEKTETDPCWRKALFILAEENLKKAIEVIEEARAGVEKEYLSHFPSMTFRVRSLDSLSDI